MKRPSVYLRRDNPANMDSSMTPMIDVVFLLLVFFVWTASFHLIEQTLPSQMSTEVGADSTPLDEPPPEQDFERVVLRIGWTGAEPTWRLNDVAFANLEEIRQQLENLARVKRDAPLILHPDPPVPLEHVISAYDEAKLVGFEQLSFAVNQGK